MATRAHSTRAPLLPPAATLSPLLGSGFGKQPGPVTQAIRAMRATEPVKTKTFSVSLADRPFPVEYALQVEGGCCAPAIPDQSFIYCDTRRAPKLGDFVVLHFTQEAAAQIGAEAWIKRLVMMVRPAVEGRKVGIQSNVMPCVVVEQLNPARVFTIQWSAIRAIHWCGGTLTTSMRLVENPAAAARRANRLNDTREACA